MRPKLITWTQYREARRWQWKMRKHHFLEMRTKIADMERENFLDWWRGPAGTAIKNSDGEFRAVINEVNRRREARRKA